MALKTDNGFSSLQNGPAAHQQPDRMHHVFRVEVELASLLRLPTGVIAVFSPFPVILMLGQCLLPRLLFEYQQPSEKARLVAFRDRFTNKNVPAENTSCGRSVVIQSVRIRNVLEFRRMVIRQ